MYINSIIVIEDQLKTAMINSDVLVLDQLYQMILYLQAILVKSCRSKTILKHTDQDL